MSENENAEKDLRKEARRIAEEYVQIEEMFGEGLGSETLSVEVRENYVSSMAERMINSGGKGVPEEFCVHCDSYSGDSFCSCAPEARAWAGYCNLSKVNDMPVNVSEDHLCFLQIGLKVPREMGLDFIKSVGALSKEYSLHWNKRDPLNILPDTFDNLSRSREEISQKIEEFERRIEK